MKRINIVTLLAFILGLIFVFIVPPFQSPDEPAHFYRAWGLASGQVTCTKVDGKYGLYVPENVVNIPEVMEVSNISFKYNNKFNHKLIIENMGTTIGNSLKFVEPSNLCSIIPFGYFPQTVAVILSKIIYPSPLFSLYLGRLLNLIFSVVLINFAISLIPLGKPILSVFVLLPMFLHQIASFNYDASHYAFTYLFIAFVLFLSYKREKIKTKEYLLLLLTSIFTAQIKFVYLPILLLLFLLKSKNFTSRRKYVLSILLIFLVNIIVTLLSVVLFKDSRLVVNVDKGVQITTFFDSPMRFLSLFVYSLDTQFDFYLKSTIGWLGWLDYGLNNLVYFSIVFFSIMFVDSENANDVAFSIKNRLILFSTFLIELIVIFLSLYIIWTPTNSLVVIGVQGRNILPFLPLLFFSVYRYNPKKYLFILILVAIYFFVFKSVAMRYW